VKLTVVGGGSTYTPELVDGLARHAGVLPVTEIALVDPDLPRLAVVAEFCRRILARHGHSARLSTSDDLPSAVDGAAAVLIQLRIGGQAARHTDETLPLPCGCIGQETTGAGGLAKALRTVPVVREIGRVVAERAPDAWIVDFTNPVGIVTRALLDDGRRAVGLCNVAIGFQRYCARLLGVPPDRVTLDHVGLNHLTWERAVLLDGTDVLPKLIADHAEELAAPLGLPAALLRRTGTVPSYYLRYFYAHDQVLAEQRREPTRAEQVTAIERDLLALYADPALDTKPALLEQRGGAYYSEAAAALLASLLGGPAGTHVVDIHNAGTLPFLPDDAVIEVPATVHNGRITPLPVAAVDPLQRGLIAHIAAYEELAVQAARDGGTGAVADALLAHPLIGQADLADQLAGILIDANRRYLPWAAR
jgi:alpha-galactosidase/6-phospho-beta-glucosidase family protein